MQKKLAEFFSKYNIFDSKDLTAERRREILCALELEYQSWFLSAIIKEIEEIMSISPDLDMREILEVAAQRIVRHLGAAAATIRLFDPENKRMSNFGSFGIEDSDRIESLAFHDSVCCSVAQSRQALAISNVLEHPLYKDKHSINNRGFYALLAVPLFSPLQAGEDSDICGVLQIYYRQKDRQFNHFEIIHAELLARRVSFVLAKKRILDLQEFNRHKETIVNKIYVRLSRREGIKLGDLFLQLIPDLEKMLHIQCCSLFTLSEDQRFIHLDAVFPPEVASHDLHHNYTVANHSYFYTPIFEADISRETECEKITPAYTLIRDLRCSSLMTAKMRKYAADQHVHSILLVPLRVAGHVRHLLVFYATEKRKTFREEEIELLTFLGKEIIKGSKLEFLGDVLHDIKNPAVAVAGFANRALNLLVKDDISSAPVVDKLTAYLEIISTEAARMQDLAQTMSGAGREEVLDLAKVAANRFKIIQEVVKESKMDHIEIMEPEFAGKLEVFCPRFGLERIIDNLLSNSAKAVPPQGGYLRMCGGCDEDMIQLVVENTSEINELHLAEIKAGKVKGRGLNIISRFVYANHGNIDIEMVDGVTRFIIKLPRVRDRKNN